MLKNRNNQIAIGVILLVVVGLGIFYFVSGASKAKPQQEQSMEGVVQELKPEEIGLTMEVSPDKKKVKFKIAKAQGIKAIEYELTYEADSTAREQSEGGEDRVQRGVTGTAEIEAGESSYESEFLVLGSESASVVRYDTGIESVDMTLKLTKDDNKVYVVQDSLEL